MAKYSVAALGPARSAPEQRRDHARAAALEMAWAFLRRNPAYRADFDKVASGALAALPDHWGLAGPVHPDIVEVDVMRIWRLDRDPRAAARSTGGG